MSQGLAAWLIVVPARLGAKRLPRKPLADLGGRPLVVRVAQNLAPLAAAGARLVVATDAEKVREACAAYGVEARLTREDHPSGTDRCWEAAEAEAGPPRPFVMNVQGDEPFAPVEDLRRLAQAMAADAEADMGTLVYAATDPALARDPNTVKCVVSRGGHALYFSRAPLPYDRDAADRAHLPQAFWQHLGVYAFRRERLRDFVALAPSPLELTEKLEQLRALEAGWKILAVPAQSAARGIDTPEDLEEARARFR